MSFNNKKSLIRLLAICGAFLLLIGNPLSISALWNGSEIAGSNVNEGAIARTYYVDTNNPSASNSNSGSVSSPFKTINYAVDIAMYYKGMGDSVKVYVKPGIYREEVHMMGRKNNQTVILEGLGEGVIITGAEKYDGWVAEGNYYTHSWNLVFGLSPDVYFDDFGISMAELVRRKEMVFVNDETMIPVTSVAALTEGTFYVDETANKIYLKPPTGTNMSSAEIEVSERERTIWLVDTSNIVLRNIDFVRAACVQGGAGVSVYLTDKLLIEDCGIYQNSYFGIGAHVGEEMTLKNCVINGNGGGGFSGSSLKNIRFDYSETSDNNWRGALGAFDDWDTGGIKILFSSNISIANHIANYNKASGIWFDSAVKNAMIIDSDISFNDYVSSYTNSVMAGIYIEGGVGPYLIDRCRVAYNRRGFNLASSEDIYIRDSVIAGNAHEQIALFSNWGYGRAFSGEETSYLKNTTIQNTVISADFGNTYPLFGWDHGDTVAVQNWSNTLRTKGVRYYHPNSANAFLLDSLGTKGSLADWQNLTGLDKGAIWFADQFTPENSVGIGMPVADSSLWRLNFNHSHHSIAAADSAGSIENMSGKFPVDNLHKYNGVSSLSVNIGGNPGWWFGTVLSSLDLTEFPEDTELRFAIKGEVGSEKLKAGFKAGSVNAGLTVTATSEWTEVVIPLEDLFTAFPSFPQNLSDGFVIYNANNNPMKVWIADIRLYSESEAEKLENYVFWSLDYDASMTSSMGVVVCDANGNVEKNPANQLFPVDSSHQYEGKDSLRLNVTGNPGWWIGMIHDNIDLTEFMDYELQFAVKGQSGGEQFKLGFKSSSQNAGITVTATSQWETVNIKIKDFLAQNPTFSASTVDGFILFNANSYALKVWIADVKIVSPPFLESEF